ncbi:hypothetical protein EDEG_01726 [Edhazardia aedis USNM 41457]|uniref:Uncharacterized protein n=1 Tax=Edhazardia aedis (strain USNM 41457) TaxID=1003232 RepID=J8ZWB9_EDHAE|nr:hypothetical protein EDEG_01726 [Edhazardia aedis USNM 41457]|eukprot:EJW03993.1 hypothetical protein EDEG_01726 [Edhazardia aedis USNM 41457]
MKQRVDRMFFLALLELWNTTNIDKKYTASILDETAALQTDPSELEKIKYLCTDILPLLTKKSVNLMKNNQGNYCIVIEKLNLYKEYLFDEIKMAEKHQKVAFLFVSFINEYLKVKNLDFNIQFVYKNMCIHFYLLKKNNEYI